jgi:Tfp pilus assembly protein PilW
MDFKITFIKAPYKRRQFGFALVEAWIAVGITALLLVVLASFSEFSGRSFAALLNYAELDDVNRIAMDKITRDVRQAIRVTYASTNRLMLLDADGVSTIDYDYSPTQRTLKRTKTGEPFRVILTECDRLAFTTGQRNAVGGTYDVYPAAVSAGTVKVVNVSWSCSRTIFGNKANTESVQTARIVIRKQGT